jgi:hypothetical protein
MEIAPLPPVPVPPAPEITRIDPPVRPADVVSPEAMCTEPPVELADPPSKIEMEPDAPPVAGAVAMLMKPDDVEVDEPVENNRLPDAGFEVFPLPVAMEIAPEPVAPDPVDNTMAPLDALVALPVMIEILPLVLVVNPVINDTEPLRDGPFALRMMMLPDGPAPPPLSMDSAPPSLPLLLLPPADSMIMPALVPAVTPTLSIMSCCVLDACVAITIRPAAADVELPVVNNTRPPLEAVVNVLDPRMEMAPEP